MSDSFNISRPDLSIDEDLSSPEVAEALRARSEQIVTTWVDEIRNVVQAARDMSWEEARDNLPNILSGMVDLLSSNNPQGSKLAGESPVQGVNRFLHKYDVRGLLHEDRLLRRTIIRQVEDELRRRMSQQEQVSLDFVIDIMLQQAVVAFVNQQNATIRLGAESELKYLSFLSHDINNNLGSVTLHLQVLRQRLIDFPEFAQDVKVLDNAQESILNTIGGMGRLLESERLRKSGIASKKTPVPLHRLMANVCQQSQRAADRKGLRLTLEVTPDDIITSDGELITLALQNLLGNAVKFSSSGTIRVSAKQLQPRHNGDGKGNGDGKDGRRWALTVTDEGPGIAPEHTNRLFEAFKRAETHGQPGIGLGLAIASQAARLLDAELTVTSTLGDGSTFRLLLPPSATLPLQP